MRPQMVKILILVSSKKLRTVKPTLITHRLKGAAIQTKTAPNYSLIQDCGRCRLQSLDHCAWATNLSKGPNKENDTRNGAGGGGPAACPPPIPGSGCRPPRGISSAAGPQSPPSSAESGTWGGRVEEGHNRVVTPPPQLQNESPVPMLSTCPEESSPGLSKNKTTK